MNSPLPDHYQTAITKLKRLNELANYESAFIFGSAARGEITEHSDLDVRIIVADQKTCDFVNHPFINGVKLDISFQTFSEIEKITLEELQTAKRIAFLAESIILFDKTDRLKKLKKIVLKAKPKKLSTKKHYWIKFMAYHATDKAKRFLKSNPLNSLYSMHSNIGEILKFHYQLNRHWWVSDKRILNDLHAWDPTLAKLLENFVQQNQAGSKFSLWQKITNHVLKPIGGPQPITEINCHCDVCKKHMDAISQIS